MEQEHYLVPKWKGMAQLTQSFTFRTTKDEGAPANSDEIQQKVVSLLKTFFLSILVFMQD